MPRYSHRYGRNDRFFGPGFGFGAGGPFLGGLVGSFLGNALFPPYYNQPFGYPFNYYPYGYGYPPYYYPYGFPY